MLSAKKYQKNYLKMSSLVGLKMIESYDLSKMKRILKADKEIGLLWEDDIKKLDSYILSYNGNTEKEVTYNFGIDSNCDYGRIYAHRSFGQLWSAVKNTVSGDDYIDIDIVSSQATIMYQLAINDLNFNNPELDLMQFKYYIDHRDDALAEIMGYYDVSKRLAKQLCTSLMNGGSLYGWKQKNNIVKSDGFGRFKFNLNRFKAEAEDIASKFLGKRLDLSNRIMKDKNISADDNMSAKIFSCVIKNIEALCLEKLYERLGCPRYGDLEHDGLRIKTPDGFRDAGDSHEIFDAILGAIEDIKEDRDLGFSLSIIVKKPTEFLAMAEEDDMDYNKVFEYFNFDEFEQLTSYQDKKKYFEIFHYLVITPKPMYYHLCYKTEGGYGRLELNEWNAKNDLSTAFRNRYFTEMVEIVKKNKKGDVTLKKTEPKQFRFIDRWLSDPNMRTYNEIDFIPSNKISSKLKYWNGKNERTYNSFLGYSLKCATPLPNEERASKLLKIWTDLVFELCGANEDFYNLYINALAHKIQFPNEKSRAGCFIFKSLQGCGKNMSLTPFEVILGEYYISSSEERDFWGTYADSFYRKIIINLNEMQLDKNGHDYEGKIKAFISEEWTSMNQKFKQVRKVRNVALPIMFTNKPKPMAIDFRTGDRRLNVSESTDKYLKYGEEFWAGMNQIFRSDEFIAVFYDFLNTRNLIGVKWAQVKTKAYIDMCSQFVQIHELWLGDWVEKQIKYYKSAIGVLPDVTEIKTQYEVRKLYEKYVEFCNLYGVKADLILHQHKFMTTIEDLKIGIITKKISIMHFELDLNKVKTELIKRKLLIKDDNDHDEIEPEVIKDNTSIFDMYGI